MNPPSIEFPTFGSELHNYLESVNTYETRIASFYIKDKMSEALRIQILSWFKMPPPELDRTLLRRIINTTLAAGDAGLERTVEALKQLRFKEVPLTNNISPQIAAEELREAVRDYRGAKNWLFNQYKCINSVLKTVKIVGNKNSQKLQQVKIPDLDSYIEWCEDLKSSWEQTTKVTERLRGSYKNNWEVFKASFDTSLMNGQYQIHLKRQIDQYLVSESEFETYIKAINDMHVQSLNSSDKVVSEPEIQIEITGPEVIFYIILNNKFGSIKKLNSIKSDFVYELSDLVSKTNTKIAISELNSDQPTLCLRMTKPNKKVDFDKISTAISDFFKNIKF